MKVFRGSEVRAWEQQTLLAESITSLELMERAASCVADWIMARFKPCTLTAICGTGNNGGDGLAIARILLEQGFDVSVRVIDSKNRISPNFTANLYKLSEQPVRWTKVINWQDWLPPDRGILLDCLFGSGFRQPLPLLTAQVIQSMNQSSLPIISLDLPSGMTADPDGAWPIEPEGMTADPEGAWPIEPGGNTAKTYGAWHPSSSTEKRDKASSRKLPDAGEAPQEVDKADSGGFALSGPQVIQASLTICLEAPKLSALIPGSGAYYGELAIIPLGLDSGYQLRQPAKYYFTEAEDISFLFKKRGKFQHKGDFGHSLLLAGSYGKAGSAVLCARACIQSGAGLVSVLSPEANYGILQAGNPEAMFIPGGGQKILDCLPKLSSDSFDAIGIGPGIGQDPLTRLVLLTFIQQMHRPMVFDADALNILAGEPDWSKIIPPGSILTPHVGEFNRLTALAHHQPIDRLIGIQKLAQDTQSVIILKGAYTAVALPSGAVHFNATGNPGMASGGSGDVLTGILVALLGQGYSSETAAIIGVYVHGKAGDLARAVLGETALKAGDICEFLGKAWVALEKTKDPFVHEELPPEK